MRLHLLILSILFMLTSCGRPFGEIPKSKSGTTPKQYLVARLVDPSLSLGRMARPGEYSSPLIVGDIIYVGSVHGQFLAIRKNSGNILWRKKIKGGVESSPQYFDNKIYFGANDGNFYCVDAKTGKTLWTYPTHVEILSKPLIKGEIVFFLTSKNELYALKAQTGKWVWYYNRGYVQKISVRGTSSPVYDDGKIYMGFSDGSFYAFNAFNGEIVWQRILTGEEKFVDVDATPIVSGGMIWVGSSNGLVYALNDKNGETLWKRQYEGIRSMTADSERLYIASFSGKVFALERSNGLKEWEYPVKTGTPMDLSVVEDQLIFGTSEDYVYSINIENGSEIWRYASGSGVLSQPIFDADRVYLFSEQSALHVIDPFYLLSDTLN